MIDDEAAREAAREILSAERFTRWNEENDALIDLVERVLELLPDWLIEALASAADAIGAFLRRLGAVLDLFGEASDALGWLALCLLAAALIAGIWQWRAARLAPVSPATAHRRDGRRHAEARREAQALAARGRTLEAAHRLQGAILALLIEFDWLELARSDPNRTLRERVRSSSLPESERRDLIRLVDRLEALWFDERREDPGLFADWLSLDERIESLARAGAS